MSVVRRIKRNIASETAARIPLKHDPVRRDMTLLAMRPSPRGFRQEHREATFKRLESVAVREL